MTAEAEQKHFWDIYEQILMENGEPFFLAPNGEADGAPCRYVQRNGENSFADRRIGVDFIPRSKTVIYGVFLDNDAGLFRSLLGRKAAIERELGFRCTWQYDEEKGVYRIVCEAEIDPFDRNGYAGAIENSIFSLTKFWEVFTPPLRARGKIENQMQGGTRRENTQNRRSFPRIKLYRYAQQRPGYPLQAVYEMLDQPESARRQGGRQILAGLYGRLRARRP